MANECNPAQQDILTGDEIISDSYDLKDVDGIVFEADCAMIEEGAVTIGSYNPSCCAIRENARATFPPAAARREGRFGPKHLSPSCPLTRFDV